MQCKHLIKKKMVLISVDARQAEPSGLSRTRHHRRPVFNVPPFFEKSSFCRTSLTRRTSLTCQTKIKTTTSLAVLKRTARQGAHWKHEEKRPPKSTRSPAQPGEAAQTLPTATFWGITKESQTYEHNRFKFRCIGRDP